MDRKPLSWNLILTGLNAALWTMVFLVNYYGCQETKKLLILQGLTAVIWWISFAFRITEHLKGRRGKEPNAPEY